MLRVCILCPHSESTVILLLQSLNEIRHAIGSTGRGNNRERTMAGWCPSLISAAPLPYPGLTAGPRIRGYVLSWQFDQQNEFLWH